MKNTRFIFEGQALHYSLLAALLTAIIVTSRAEGFLAGEFLNTSTSVWFYLALAVPILHQVFVWFVWRAQLHFSLITRLFGPKGFKYYYIIFMVLLISRLVFIIGIAISNKDSLHCNQLLLDGFAFIIAVPTVYLFYSVVKYFGLKRAVGIDHFDPSYRHKPLVREGIFRFSSNSMYIFGLLVLWLPGLLYGSVAALLAALFNHIYIWIHYYSTEKPDMRRLYGNHTASTNPQT